MGHHRGRGLPGAARSHPSRLRGCHARAPAATHGRPRPRAEPERPLERLASRTRRGHARRATTRVRQGRSRASTDPRAGDETVHERRLRRRRIHAGARGRHGLGRPGGDAPEAAPCSFTRCGTARSRAGRRRSQCSATRPAGSGGRSPSLRIPPSPAAAHSAPRLVSCTRRCRISFATSTSTSRETTGAAACCHRHRSRSSTTPRAGPTRSAGKATCAATSAAHRRAQPLSRRLLRPVSRQPLVRPGDAVGHGHRDEPRAGRRRHHERRLLCPAARVRRRAAAVSPAAVATSSRRSTRTLRGQSGPARCAGRRTP